VNSGPHSPDALRPLLTGPLCPVTIYALPKFHRSGKLILQKSTGVADSMTTRVKNTWVKQNSGFIHENM
jgi:hypothetical protein